LTRTPLIVHFGVSMYVFSINSGAWLIYILPEP
jgi:hypothetical protein